MQLRTTDARYSEGPLLSSVISQRRRRPIPLCIVLHRQKGVYQSSSSSLAACQIRINLTRVPAGARTREKGDWRVTWCHRVFNERYQKHESVPTWTTNRWPTYFVKWKYRWVQQFCSHTKFVMTIYTYISFSLIINTSIEPPTLA